MNGICGVKGCTEQSKYLVKIGTISFELCEKHHRLKWILKPKKAEMRNTDLGKSETAGGRKKCYQLICQA